MSVLSLTRCAPLLLVVATYATAQAPQPGSGAARLAIFAGTWHYEGDAQATPLGPAAKISGTQTGRLVMSGFGFQWQGQESGAFGGVQWGEIDVYDAASKRYPYLGYQSDGTVWSGSNVVVGNTWKASGTLTSKAVTYSFRQETEVSADSNTGTWTSDISADGKTWVPWTKGTLTRAK